MYQKILTALQQGHKNLGLDAKVFEGVAKVYETLITDESKIDEIVKSDACKNLLASYQSQADKIRTELNGKIKTLEGEKSELEARLKGNPEPKPTPEPKPNPEPQPTDMAKLIQDAVAAAVTPLMEDLAGIKSDQAAKTAIADAEAAFKANDYVKKYGDEASDAWERAMEVYELGGKKLSSDEIREKAMGYFNRSVAKKGVDTSKPFVSEGDPENTDTDFSKMKELLKSEGIELGTAE